MRKRPPPNHIPELAQYTTGQLVDELHRRTTEMIIVTVFESEDGQMINHDLNCSWTQALGLCGYLRLRLEHLIQKYQIDAIDGEEE